MAAESPVDATVAEVMAELAALEDPRARAVNEKYDDDHGEPRQAAGRRETAQDAAGARGPALGDGRQCGEAAGAPDLPT